jgi:hypothetical protein
LPPQCSTTFTSPPPDWKTSLSIFRIVCYENSVAHSIGRTVTVYSLPEERLKHPINYRAGSGKSSTTTPSYDRLNPRSKLRGIQRQDSIIRSIQQGPGDQGCRVYSAAAVRMHGMEKGWRECLNRAEENLGDGIGVDFFQRLARGVLLRRLFIVALSNSV